ncbi:MAG: hypothetical protein HZB71_01075 [Betaproteobacteria bacterium]|nr:hypothetical protein [Betaproteobacteria bacterium]
MNTPSDTRKRREIVFHALPPGQVEGALAFLADLPGLSAARLDAHTLLVEYDVARYTLETLETALDMQGFHLEGSLMQRLRRAMAHYCEHVQRQNLGLPDALTKNYQGAYVEAWQHRPHGDHDATPEEWRQYK